MTYSRIFLFRIFETIVPFILALDRKLLRHKDMVTSAALHFAT